MIIQSTLELGCLQKNPKDYFLNNFFFTIFLGAYQCSFLSYAPIMCSISTVTCYQLAFR